MKKITTILVLACTVCFNATGKELISELQKCQDQENALKRLVCFDEATKDLSQSDRAIVPTIQAHSKPSSPQKPAVVNDNTPTQFGLEHKADTDALPDTIFAAVTTLKKNTYKKYTISLDNGQVWTQSDNERLRLSVGENVYIKRGMLGAFYMSKEGVNQRIRVKRVK
jgi:hypothetical protein